MLNIFNKQLASYLLKIALILMCLLGFGSAMACTELQLSYNQQFFVGRNFDFQTKYAAVVVNPRGTLNNTKVLLPKSKQLQWVAKYGSVTIDLAEKNGHIYLPAVMTGINEYGLSASTLWLSKAEFPANSLKPTIPTSLWPKYFLDNAKTVAEAIQLAEKVDVEPNQYPGRVNVNLHLFIHDASGDAALMEYLRGKLVVYHGKDLPILAITNNPYSESLQYNKQFKGFDCNTSLDDEFGSLPRFAKIAYILKNMPTIESKQQAIAFTFHALNYVSSPFRNEADSKTVWSAVFDLTDKTLYFRSVDNQQIRMVRLNKFNFSNKQPTKALSINNDLSGYVENKFIVLKPDTN